MRLQKLADVGDGAELGNVDNGGKRATAVVRDDQVIGLKTFEGLPDGGAPHAQLGGQRHVVHGFARSDVEHDQAVLELLVRQIRHGGHGSAPVISSAQLVVHRG